jgi:hypothetical protein
MAVFDGVIPAIIGAANAAGADSYEIERSLRFNSADTAHLSRTMSTFTDINVGTVSFWLKRSALGAGVIAAGWNGSVSYSGSIQFNSTDNALQVSVGGAAAYTFKTNALLRDFSAWYHVVAAWDRSASAADKVKVWINGVAQTSSDTGYQSWTSGDCQIWAANSGNRIGRGDADRYNNLLNGFLAEYHYIDGQALDESYFGEFDSNGIWNPKEYDGTYGNEGFYLNFSDNSNDAALGTDSSGNDNDWTVNNITAVGHDYVQSTTGTLYSGSWDQAFNGSTSTPAPYIYNTTASVSWDINISGVFEIYTSLPGTYAGNPTVYTLSNGATYSKETTAAEWINLGSQTNVTSLSVNAPDPGTYIFAIRVDGTILVSSEPGDTDSLIDSPTNYEADSGNNRGNYCTLNPLKNQSQTLKNGNLVSNGTSGRSTGTLYASSGKVYWEFTAGTDYVMSGIESSTSPYAASYSGENDQQYALYAPGQLYHNGSATSFDSFVTGDVIGVALDMDGGNLYFYKNGSAMNSGNAAVTGLTGAWTANCRSGSGAYNGDTIFNFGQRPFEYTPPTGYVSLCTQNLPNPTIAKGSTAMDVVTYTGAGGTQTISSLNFSPDFVWIKSRSIADQHCLFDTVRGTLARLQSNSANAESSVNQYGSLTAFNSDGFTLTAGSSGSDQTHGSGNTYVGWTWDSGTVDNPVGDIWLGSATKYIGVKFSSASGGTISFGQTTGTTTVEVWSSSDNSNWTQQGGTLTLADGHTLTFTDQYVYIRNTSDATFTDWFAAATDGADGHYSSVTYPSGASWSGPTYTDYDWRDPGGVINENGSNPSVVSANTSAGFSIVGYTGTGAATTIGHGLNAAPEFIVVKNRDTARPWSVFHQSITNMSSGYINLNSANAFTGSYTGVWNGTDPTSSVFSVGTDSESNNSGDGFIGYCWTPVEGYSAFGSYTGNANADGPFVFTGFRPEWILIRNVDTANNWLIYDAARNSFNVTDLSIQADEANSETHLSNDEIDILSNGFKIRGTRGDINGSGNTIVFAAFASHPFKTARAR